MEQGEGRGNKQTQRYRNNPIMPIILCSLVVSDTREKAGELARGVNNLGDIRVFATFNNPFGLENKNNNSETDESQIIQDQPPDKNRNLQKL